MPTRFSNGCGLSTRSGGRTPGPTPVDAEVGVHLLDEFLEPRNDIGVLRGHVGQFADVGVEVVEARAGVLYRLGCALGQAGALRGDGQLPRAGADGLQLDCR